MIPEKQIERLPVSQKFEVFDHFLGFPLTSGSFFSPFNFQVTLTNTGAGIQSVTGDLLNPGIIRLLSGTVGSGGVAGAGSKTGIKTANTLFVGSADLEVEFLHRVNIVATSAEDYEYFIGFIDSVGGAPSTGAYIYFDWGTSNTIQCILKNTSGANARTLTPSNTVQGTGWTKVNIKIPRTADRAIYTFNDTDVITINTNTPLTTDALGMGALMTKYQGTTNQQSDLGYFKFTYHR